MKITIAKDAGYCFGVRDAVNMAYDATDQYGEVYMLGSIVHNEKVVDDLEKAGAIIVSNLDEVPLNSPILFRAHGTISELWKEAKSKKKDLQIFQKQSVQRLNYHSSSYSSSSS